MEDQQIIDLYWARAENAIAETAAKYGRYCRCIADNILHSAEDSEECVNDTYLRAWNAMPPQRPGRLAAFLGKITRNLALDRYRNRTAEKRGAGRTAPALEELEECLPSAGGMDRIADDLTLKELLDRFLGGLAPEARVLFMRRYWYLNTVREIAADLGLSESKVKMSLLRSRNALRKIMEKEGI